MLFASFNIANIWLSVNLDVFMQNLLGKSYEKILLSTSINFRGDYQRAQQSMSLCILEVWSFPYLSIDIKITISDNFWAEVLLVRFHPS